MAKVKKIMPFSFAKFQAVLFGLLGLLAGIVYSFGGLIIDTVVTLGWVVTPETPGLSYGTVLAFGALVGMPIIFAVFGLIAGLVEASLYNLFAKKFGCVEMNFKKKVYNETVDTKSRYKELSFLGGDYI